MPDDNPGGVDPMPECDPGKCSDTGQPTDPNISPDLGSGPGPGPVPADDDAGDDGDSEE